MVGYSSAWADEYNYNFSSGGTHNSSASPKTNTWVTDYFTILQQKNSSTTDVGNYLTAPRWYKNHTVTITPADGVTITEITVNGTSGYSGQDITASTGSVSKSGDNSTWSGSITSSSPLVLTMGAQCRPSSLDVTYSSSGGSLANSDLALTGAPIALPFDLYNDKDAKVINYTTSSTGAVTVSESDYVTTVVDAANKKITVTPKTLTTPSAQTITVSQAADASYKAGSATFTVTITDSDPTKPGSLANPYTVAQARAAIDAGTGITGVYATGIVSQIVTAYNSTYGNISYNISTDGLTTSDQLQAYRGKNNNGENFTSADDVKVGDIVIVYGNLKKYNSTYEFDENNWLVSRVRKADPELSAVSATIDNMDATTSVAANTLYTVTSDGEISFSSDKEDVANVVAGNLCAYKPGTAKITVSVAETAAYAAGNVDITVTVTTKPAVNPEGPAAGSTYSLVTDAATLNAGDKLLITSTGSYTYSKVTYNFSWVMAGQGDGIRNVEDVTISENTITTVPANAQVVTLEEAPESKWYLSVGSGNYLNSGNKAITTSTSKTAFGITISSNDATISDGTYSLQCNPNNGNGRFACYSSTQKPVQIYRQNVASTFDITINSKGDGWRTIVTSASATLPSGLKAYIASADESDKVTLTEVASLKANNAYILYGAVGDYTLTVTDSPEEPTGNELRVSTDADGNGAFVLAKKGGVVGFYKWNGGSLGAGRVILPASAVPDAPARDFIGLGDATAISNVIVETKSDNRYYNLAGQVVAQPTKGLYIVNGKKVIIK